MMYVLAAALVGLAVLVSQGQATSLQDCHCGLYLESEAGHDGAGQVEMVLAFATGVGHPADCQDVNKAQDACRTQCQLEVDGLNQAFRSNPEMLVKYPPYPSRPCPSIPAHPAAFFSVCEGGGGGGGGGWMRVGAQLATPVCCGGDGRPVWCGTEDINKEDEEAWRSLGASEEWGTQEGEAWYPEEGEEEARGIQRKIDTDTDQNAIEANEIEGSTLPEKQPSEGGWSWMTSLLKFFGYSSVSEMMSNIDIFSLPSKIQSAVKTYSDEISMGRCYMEFTTYSLFSKQDNVFSSFLRTKRQAPVYTHDYTYTQDFTHVEDSAWTDEDDEGRMINGGMEAWTEEQVAALLDDLLNGQMDGLMDELRTEWEARSIGRQDGTAFTIESMAMGLARVLDGSESTRQYADIIRQVLPAAMQLYSSDDPTMALTTFITHTLGPYLMQIQAPPKSPNSVETRPKPAQTWPNLERTPEKIRPNPSPSQPAPSSSPGAGPIADMVLQFLKYYMGNYLSSLPGNENSKPPPPPSPTPRPQHYTQSSPSRPASSASSPASSGPSFASILSMLFSPSRAPSPRPRPPVKKPPQKAPAPTKATVPPVEKKDTKTFVGMVLEFIRPVFISIIGKAPGESGVDSIREVTRLSTLGRVDDSLIEEVMSPYYCFKNYAVNKAWTLTERGVRSVVSKFDNKEQARMMRMLKE